MEQAKEKVKELCINEIEKGKLFVGFYLKQEAKQSKEKAAQTKLKRMQVQDTIDFNTELLDYINSL